MKSLTIIKLGGSIITDKSKPYTANFKAIRQLIKEIKKANLTCLVVHGAGSFAHTSAKKYGGKKGYNSLLGVTIVSRDAQALNQIILEEFIKAKVPAITFRPNSMFSANEGKAATQHLIPLVIAINQGIIPIIYGDVIMDNQWKTTIFSGETSTGHIVDFLIKNNFIVKKVVQVGRTDGVYGANGVTIPLITEQNFQDHKKDIFQLKTADVTGGMMHKVEEALKLGKKGLKTYIINGTKKNALYNALIDQNFIGTKI